MIALLSMLPVVPAALAQDAPSSFDGLLEGLQLKAKVAPAPDFVEKTRPREAPGFVPVGQPHPDRPGKVMTPEEVAATEAQLDAARIRQQKRAGQKPPPVPLKSETTTTSQNTVR